MIQELVSNLPEIYQPIFGHPELSDETSRQCTDRLAHIVRIYDAMQRLLNRPLKVLDLGCAQGFFSLNLAERGANVHGVDFLDKNIAVCIELAKECPTLQASFETGRIEDCIQRLKSGEYDLVLGLSVFHHIVHEHGAVFVKDLLSHVATQSGVLVAELALREEPLYWALAQPKSPRELLEEIPFVHECARHGTHLAPIERPLFVASNFYWVLQDQAIRFDSWETDPHSLAQNTHEGSRRYFFSQNLILKMYDLDHSRGGHNKKEFLNEIRFLQSPPKEFSAPKIISHGESCSEAWVVMERLPGRLLLDVLREGETFDSRFVLRAVLEKMVALESAGLYHNDMRAWNVLLSNDGSVSLIDYGSISAQAQDCAWPGNLFLAFFIFVKEVTTGNVDDPKPPRVYGISPLSLPQPYQLWAETFWGEPMEKWSFKLMLDRLLEIPDGVSEGGSTDANKVWMKAIEEAIEIEKSFVKLTQTKAEQAIARSAKAEENEARSLSQMHEALQIAKQAQELTQQAEARSLRAEENEARSLSQMHEALQIAKQAQELTQQAEARSLRAEENQARSLSQMHEALQIAKQAQELTQQSKEQAKARVQELVSELERTQQELNLVLQANHQHWLQLQQTRSELDAILQENHRHWQLSELRLQELGAVYKSKSWRLTAPLRWPAQQIRLLRVHGLKIRLKQLINKVLRTINFYLLARPVLRYRLLSLSKRLGIYNRLKKVRDRLRDAPNSPGCEIPDATSTELGYMLESGELTRHARQIYTSLILAKDQQQKGSS